MLPSPQRTGSASTTSVISWLIPIPHTIAVYASAPPLPVGPATLATGRLATPYPGGTSTRWTAPASPGAPAATGPPMRNTRPLDTPFHINGDMSRRMYMVLAARVPRVEPYSIDEMFMDMDTPRDAADLARELRHAVRRIAKIPTCVGIGPTKTIALIAKPVDMAPVRPLAGTVARLGVKRRLSFAGRCRWLAGTSVRSRNRACHCGRRSEPGAAGRRRVATSASAATCSSGGSPGSWRFLR